MRSVDIFAAVGARRAHETLSISPQRLRIIGEASPDVLDSVKQRSGLSCWSAYSTDYWLLSG